MYQKSRLIPSGKYITPTQVGNKTVMGLEQLMIGLELPMTGFLGHIEGLGFMDGARGLSR